ncbi:MAG: hypothetical protein ACYC4Q_00390 [Victivallaceae bacterium]
MITIQNADEYFSRNLQKQQWMTLSDEQKEAALEMASGDICCRLGSSEIDETCVFQVCAVYEQALFLAANIGRLNDCVEVLSENIDGVGGKSYRERKNPEFSRRALLFLERATGLVTRLNRG